MILCGKITWYEKKITQREAYEAQRSGIIQDVRLANRKSHYILVVESKCALLPGHAGVCRCEEQLLQMIEAAAE